MRVAIVGSRNCKSFRIEQILDNLPQGCSQIISGGADGVDSYAEKAARELGIPFVCIAPDYQKYGKNAPFVRNRMIVQAADLVLAFWDYYSRGTAHTIAACIEKGISVRIFEIEISP